MAGPYTAKPIRRHSQTSPRVESPRQIGQQETEEYMAKNVLEEAKGVNENWAEIKTDAKNRVRWRILVEDLYSAAE
jgi:hypothetical protein